MAAVEDLSFKTGCLCVLISFYFKFPDCIGCSGTCDICCWNQGCRLAFPMSICTGMGQCCCIDVRAAFPFDVSKVPITVGVLGMLCVNCDRKGLCAPCSKYAECNLYQFLPCLSPDCMGFDESKFEEHPISFAMNKRSKVYARDADGEMIIISRPEYKDMWHFRVFERRREGKTVKTLGSDVPIAKATAVEDTVEASVEASVEVNETQKNE